MNARRSHLARGTAGLGHVGRTVLLLFLVVVYVVAVHQRALAAVRVNQACLGILHSLKPEVTWVEHAVLGSTAMYSAEGVEQALQLLVVDHEALTPTEGPRTVGPAQGPMALLSSLQFVRHRDSLGRLFVAMQLVHGQQDEAAIAELLDLGAWGVLGDIGAKLNQRGELQRSTKYLEAAAKLAPDSYRIIRQLAVVYLSDKRNCELVRTARRGVDLYDSALFYYFLGRAYEGLEAWPAAAQAYQQALERFPDYGPYERLLRRAIEHAAIDPDAVVPCDQ